MERGQEFHSNSHRSRGKPPEPDDEKKIEVAITGKAIVRKKSLGKRIKELLVGGDTDSVLNYLIGDVIIPQMKDLLTEAVTQGIERLIHGDGRSSSRRPPRSGGSTNYTNYGRYSRPPTPASRGHDRPRAVVRTHGVDDVILEDRYDAQCVLDELVKTADKYSIATVADLYASVERSASHTDGKWGWDSDALDEARIRKIREGYILELPQPEYID